MAKAIVSGQPADKALLIPSNIKQGVTIDGVVGTIKEGLSGFTSYYNYNGTLSYTFQNEVQVAGSEKLISYAIGNIPLTKVPRLVIFDVVSTLTTAGGEIKPTSRGIWLNPAEIIFPNIAAPVFNGHHACNNNTDITIVGFENGQFKFKQNGQYSGMINSIYVYNRFKAECRFYFYY